MLRKIRSRMGQLSAAEYAILFSIVAATYMTMTVFVKRALQGRVLAGRNGMVGLAEHFSNGYYEGPFIYEYEPYYKESKSSVQRDSTRVLVLDGSLTDVEVNEEYIVDKAEITFSPLSYNATDPINYTYY